MTTLDKVKPVKRVVLTSSYVVVYGDTKDMLELRNGTATD